MLADILNDRECMAGWLIDGRGGPARPATTFRCQDGRLVSLEDAVASPPGPETMDLSDCTVLPGLVDAHVHLFMEATADPARRKLQLDTTYQERLPVMALHGEQTAGAGVVAVRDGGDYGGFALRFALESRVADDAPVNRLAIRAAGRAWRAAGRYGKLIGRPPRKGETLAEAVKRDLAVERPGDLVKIAQSGINSLDVFGKVTPPQFTAEELRGAVDIAHAQGRTVMVHGNGPEPVGRLIEAGCDSIEHGYFATLEVLERTVGSGTVWVPTLAPMWAISESPDLPANQRDIARRTLDHQLETVGRAARAGVTIAAGSDAGGIGVEHGAGLWAELWLLRQAGLSVEQVVQAATTTGARLLGVEDLTGGLRVGGPATFIAVQGSPAELFNSPEPKVCKVQHTGCAAECSPESIG